MRKRNRLTLFLVMPLVVFLWVFGWSLHWIGSYRRMPKLMKQDDGKHLTFAVLMLEQEYAK